jgi:hypothetical protein
MHIEAQQEERERGMESRKGGHINKKERKREAGLIFYIFLSACPALSESFRGG